MVSPHDKDDKWEYLPKTPYEITIRPYAQEPHNALRFINATSKLKEIKKNLYCKLLLFPELSQPKYSLHHETKVTYIHWHGIIYFESNTDIFNFLLTQWNDLVVLYHIQINPYREDYWLKYCIKQQNIIPAEHRICSAYLYNLYIKKPLPALEGAHRSTERDRRSKLNKNI